jgi:PAS domain S-box-containing protein
MQKQLRLSRRIRLTFLAAGLLLTGLALLNLYVTRQKVRERVFDSQLVNCSGHQRMYSQKLTKDALLVLITTDPKTRRRQLVRLKQDLEHWQSEHTALFVRGQVGSDKRSSNNVFSTQTSSTHRSLYLPGQNNAAIRQLFTKLIPKRQQMQQALYQIIRIEEAHLEGNHLEGNHLENRQDKAAQVESQRASDIESLVGQLTRLEPELLAYYEQLTWLYKKEANAKLTGLESLLWFTTLSGIGVIVLLGVLLFLPLKKIIEHFIQQQGLQIAHLQQTQAQLQASQDQLQSSEQLYRLLSENTRDLITLFDADGKFIFVSVSVNEILGYSAQELIGHSSMDLIHPDDRKYIEHSHQQSLAGDSKAVEYRMRAKDGTYHWLETKVKLYFDTSGALTRVQASSRDITERKIRQQALSQVTQRLEAILDSSFSGIMVFSSMRDQQGQIVDFQWQMVNQTAERLLQKPADSLIGKQMLVELPGCRQSGLFDLCVELVQTNKPLNMEHYYTYDGYRVWLHTVAVQLDDGFVATFADISARKQAEESLAESNRLVNALFEHSPLPIQIFDQHGFSLRMNQARQHFLGLPSTTYGVGVYNTLHDPLAIFMGWDKHYRQAYGGQTITLTDQRLDFDSSVNSWQTNHQPVYYDEIIFPICNSSGSVGAVVSFIQETTRQVLLRQHMQQLTQFNSSLVQAIPNYLFVVDGESFQILYANTELCTMLGKTAEQLQAMDSTAVLALGHPDDNEKIGLYFDKIRQAADAKVFSTLCRLRNHQGEYRILQRRDIVFKRDAEGKVTQILGCALDITEMIEAEEELRSHGEMVEAMNQVLHQTIEQLQATQAQLIEAEKMASLGQLTAGIAHEINNPINFVYAGVANMKRSLKELYGVLDAYQWLETASDAIERDHVLSQIKRLKEELYYQHNKEGIWLTLQAIENGASRTAEIVRALRSFSRLDESEHKRVNVHECLESTLILLGNQIRDRIRIIKEYELNLPQIECYPGPLNQVFLNLLTNAIQAIDGQGSITLTTRSEADRIRIEIADNGRGMSPEEKQRIFEPFFTTKPVGEGTGLGLSISYGIIQKHKGSIQVHSQMGHGSVFILELPLVLTSQPA